MNDEPSKINVSGSNLLNCFQKWKKYKLFKSHYFRPKQYNERGNGLITSFIGFAPEGQDVMELYATDETTGEKTQIHSYDEFVAWIKAHPKN